MKYDEPIYEELISVKNQFISWFTIFKRNLLTNKHATCAKNADSLEIYYLQIGFIMISTADCFCGMIHSK